MLLLRIVSHNLGPFIFHGNKERSIVAYLSCSLVDLKKYLCLVSKLLCY